MTFVAQEESANQGEPVEFYEFRSGSIERFRWTSAETTLSIGGFDYLPLSISRTALVLQDLGRSKPMTITVPKDNPVASKYKLFVPAVDIEVTVFRTHLTDTANEIEVIAQGSIKNVVFRNEQANIEVEAVARLARTTGPRRNCGSLCNHTVYDIRCGLNEASFRLTGTVINVVGNTLTSSAFTAQPNQWLREGFVRLAGTTDQRQILDHISDTITILAPFDPSPLGAAVEAFAGCDRAPLTCRNKFSNKINFGGFEFRPLVNPYEVGLT